jgi:hypothetical protein
MKINKNEKFPDLLPSRATFLMSYAFQNVQEWIDRVQSMLWPHFRRLSPIFGDFRQFSAIFANFRRVWWRLFFRKKTMSSYAIMSSMLWLFSAIFANFRQIKWRFSFNKQCYLSSVQLTFIWVKIDNFLQILSAKINTKKIIRLTTWFSMANIDARHKQKQQINRKFRVCEKKVSFERICWNLPRLARNRVASSGEFLPLARLFTILLENKISRPIFFLLKNELCVKLDKLWVGPQVGRFSPRNTRSHCDRNRVARFFFVHFTNTGNQMSVK